MSHIVKLRAIIGTANSKDRFFLWYVILALFACLATPAYAQNNGAGTETVVVSASRITSSGFAAPTPTTVIGTRDIEQTAQPNLFTTITQLPTLGGSTGTQSGQGGTSGGNNGLSAFGQRNLGTIRSLTLLDSQRVVPANVTGIADVSQFPQLLISRVDVVSGGASASWGSDAVGGVINFVTNKNFNGIKGNIQGGITTYGDDTNGLIQLAGGAPLFEGKGHIEASVEFFRNDGVPGANTPGGGLPNGRCCAYNSGNLSYNLNSIPQSANGVILTAAGKVVPCTAANNNCLPQTTRSVNVQPNTTSEYGLINSGPLATLGLAFNADGRTVSPFNFGVAPAGYQVPGTVRAAACVSTNCVGGDLTDTTRPTSVDDPITRSVFYTRLSYNLTPSIELYGTYTLSSVFTDNTPNNAPGSFPVSCSNFYLPAALATTACAAGTTSFNVGISFDKFAPIKIESQRQMRRYVAGADGGFSAFGSDWTFDSYFQHGETGTGIHLHNLILLPRYAAATDAVAGPNGSVVCRANLTTITAPGCVPFNIVGAGPLTPDVIAYVDPPINGPYALTSERQEAASFSVNGKPFQDWAGDVAMAFGAEYREEAYVTVADPYGDGVTAANPNTPDYPADPVLDPKGNNYRSGNYHSGSGNYHVYEAFTEFGIPLLDMPQFGKVDGNIAGRATVYSTSGFVDTWKVGLTWDTPLNGLRFRALQSRDVRAPNLSELFTAPITTSNLVTDRTLPTSAPQVQVLTKNVGNPNLQPEKAATTELGVVYQPDFLPGFNLSVDYYRIALKGQVGSLNNQQIIDLCQVQGNAAYCPLISLKAGTGLNFVLVEPFNLAQVTTDGFDVEASYQFDLEDWGIPGSFAARGLATHVSKFITNSGVAGAAITESAGTSGNPLWKLNLVQSWRTDLLSFNLTERYFSNGVVNPYGIVCAPGSCPLATAQNPTFSAMNTPGNLFIDVGGTYKVSASTEAYFKVDNVADRLAGPIAGASDNTLGRVYRLGVRFTN